MVRSSTYALDATWQPLLADLGLSAGDVLRRAGLPEGLFAQPEARLDAATFYRFWEGITSFIGADALPVRIADAIRAEAFSPPLFAALCSPNFLTAAERIARYKPLIAPMQIAIQREATRVALTLHWRPEDPTPPASLVATELLFFVRLARIGTRETITPLAVISAVSQPQADTYTAFLGTRMRAGPQHQLIFDATDAQRPFLTANSELWAMFEPALRTRLAELDRTVSVSERVRAALHEQLPSGQVTMRAVARRLAMSERSLQRQLAREASSYTRVLQETRQAVAEHYLRRTDLPMATIAFLLGFAEPNSFYRAFRAWTGETPDRVRQRRG